MGIAAEIFLEKLALVPVDPAPVLPNSSNVTEFVLGSLGCQVDQPRELMTLVMLVF